MHTLIIHPNFPSQFGELAMALSKRPGDKVTFFTSVVPQCGPLPFDVVSYRIGNRPVPHQFNEPHGLMSSLAHAEAVALTCAAMPTLKPDVVLGHASYGTWLYLRGMYNARFVAYHEIIPPPYWSEEFNLRPDYPPDLPSRLYNATAWTVARQVLEYADAIYTPTQFQATSIPAGLGGKTTIVHDGIPTDLFKRHTTASPRRFHGVNIDLNHKVVTYLSRGLESFRGFDKFMAAARIVADAEPNAIFLVAGSDRVVYGHDLLHTDGKTFKEHVLASGDFPLDRIHFLGMIPASELTTFYSLSDCHVYLTVPWVLSWSVVQAMSCRAPVVVSNTPPCWELVDGYSNGMRAEFDDPDDIAASIHAMLCSPEHAARMATAGRQAVQQKFSTDVCIPRIIDILEGK